MFALDESRDLQNDHNIPHGCVFVNLPENTCVDCRVLIHFSPNFLKLQY